MAESASIASTAGAVELELAALLVRILCTLRLLLGVEAPSTPKDSIVETSYLLQDRVRPTKVKLAPVGDVATELTKVPLVQVD
jgi:hypothetical protein